MPEAAAARAGRVTRRRAAALAAGYAGAFVALRRLAAGDVRGAAKVAALLVLIAKLCCGSQDSLLTALFGLRRPRVRYSGDGCAPGYEEVQRVFEAHFDQGIELGAQCCAYVGGKRVVDLCGAREHATTQGYGPSSLQNIFSSSKAVTSVVVAVLVDQGHLRYDQRVSDVWPEFAQEGKGDVTVAELMRHEAGCAYLTKSLPVGDLTAERIKQGAVSAALAAQKPHWPKDSRRDYHGETRGFYINEVLRRADPKGRTVGEFLRDEVAQPLGVERELYIGLPTSEHARVAPLVPPPMLWGALHALLPRRLGSLMTSNIIFFFLVFLLPKLGVKDKRAIPGFTDPELPEKAQEDVAGKYNAAKTRRAEIPSANGHATARGLARVAAGVAAAAPFAGAGDGRLDGVRLLSAAGYAAAHADPVALPTFFGMKTNFTNAGVNIFSPPAGMQDRGGFIGWMGYGGSACQWHPEKQIGFAYAMNAMEPDLDNQRSLRLQQALLRCVAAQQRR